MWAYETKARKKRPALFSDHFVITQIIYTGWGWGGGRQGGKRILQYTYTYARVYIRMIYHNSRSIVAREFIARPSPPRTTPIIFSGEETFLSPRRPPCRFISDAQKRYYTLTSAKLYTQSSVYIYVCVCRIYYITL